MAEPDWLELAWKLSGSGMSKTRFAEVYADKIDKVPAGSHSAKAAVAALAPAPDQTNAEVSDERLRELSEPPFAWVRHGKSKWFWRYSPPTSQSGDGWFPVYRSHEAALNRRSVTSQASEGEAEPFNTGVGWENLSCDDQFALARKIASNVGYVLVAEPLISETEDRAETASPSKRVERLETALSEIAATTPAPLSEADVAPAMFAKLNAAIKTARQAL